MSETLKAPGQITEEFTLPLGLPWADKVYKQAVLRAEQFGDEWEAVDILVAQGKASLDLEGDGAKAEVPTLALAHAKRLLRIVRVATEDGSDVLDGESLRTALFRNGLHPEDGSALMEADERLGKKLPGASGSSAPAGSSRSGSRSSATQETKSEG